MIFPYNLKSLQPVGQAPEFKFAYKFKPKLVIWQSLPKTIPEDNRRFWLQNQWPSLWGSKSTAWADQIVKHQQTALNGVSELAAAAAGSNRLAWGKSATTLKIVT